MGNSIEKPVKRTVFNCGEMAYDEKIKHFECPPITINNSKEVAKAGMPILEGEVAIKLGYVKYQKDENGKIVNVKFLEKEEYIDKKEDKKEEKKVQEESR